MAVFKIKDMSHPQWKYKIDIYVQQLMVTGCCLIHPQVSVLIVEAGPKSMRQYKKLLLQRIKWDE
ncbi:PRP3 pre-mRNA processing factor 3-like protein, partial [Rozella allomycis CSF55]